MAYIPGFLEELKRRHVWQAATAYATATQVFPFFNVPNWVVRVVVVLLALGFPVTVGFAWVFERTPEGIRRTVPSDSPDVRSALAHRAIGRKLNALIIGVLVVAAALMGWRMLVLQHAVTRATPATLAATPAAKPADAAAKPFNPPPIPWWCCPSPTCPATRASSTSAMASPRNSPTRSARTPRCA